MSNFDSLTKSLNSAYLYRVSVGQNLPVRPASVRRSVNPILIVLRVYLWLKRKLKDVCFVSKWGINFLTSLATAQVAVCANLIG